MRMANAREILGRAAELHQHASLRDEFARCRTDDVNAEHAIRCRVGKDFYEAFHAPHRPRTAVGGKREFPNPIGNALGLESSSLAPTAAISGMV